MAENRRGSKGSRRLNNNKGRDRLFNRREFFSLATYFLATALLASSSSPESELDSTARRIREREVSPIPAGNLNKVIVDHIIDSALISGIDRRQIKPLGTADYIKTLQQLKDFHGNTPEEVWQYERPAFHQDGTIYIWIDTDSFIAAELNSILKNDNNPKRPYNSGLVFLRNIIFHETQHALGARNQIVSNLPGEFQTIAIPDGTFLQVSRLEGFNIIGKNLDKDKKTTGEMSAIPGLDEEMAELVTEGLNARYNLPNYPGVMYSTDKLEEVMKNYGISPEELINVHRNQGVIGFYNLLKRQGLSASKVVEVILQIQIDAYKRKE